MRKIKDLMNGVVSMSSALKSAREIMRSPPAKAFVLSVLFTHPLLLPDSLQLCLALAVFFFLSFFSFLEVNRRMWEWGRGCCGVAHRETQCSAAERIQRLESDGRCSNFSLQLTSCEHQ